MLNCISSTQQMVPIEYHVLRCDCLTGTCNILLFRLSETDYVLRHLPLLSTNGRPCSSNTWKLGFNMQPLVRAGTSTSVNPFVAKLMPCEISNKDIASRHTYSRSKIAFIVSCTFFHGLRFAAPSILLRQYQYLPYFLLISYLSASTHSHQFTRHTKLRKLLRNLAQSESRND